MKRSIFSLTALLCLLANPLPALAVDTFNGVCQDQQTANSAICQSQIPSGQNPDEKNPISGDNGILISITKIVGYIAGAAAVIIMIVGGIKFVNSGGNPEKAKSARNTIIGAFIGLLVIVLAAALISFVLNRLNL